jgi:hypothetical protein
MLVSYNLQWLDFCPVLVEPCYNTKNLGFFFFFSPELMFIIYFLLQKLKTRVIKQNINPEWNDDLTLSIVDPKLPVLIVSILVFSLDTIRLTILIGNDDT